MTRIALIASFFALLLTTAAGGFYYFRTGSNNPPALKQLHPGHDMASYKEQPGAALQLRRKTLQLVEKLGGVQDRIIRGDRDAVADQSRLLFEIANVIRGFEAKDWDDYVNVRASLVYVLSGGDPEVLKPYVNGNTPHEADRNLAQGIMSFAQGQTKAARKLFENVDPRSLDISLVGPFALARASLYLEKDGAKAIGLLDEARLASPHTAIEEAAARREIPILVSTGNAPRAMMLAADYVRRFGESIYAKKLFRDFSVAVAKRADLDDVAVVTNLLAAVEGTDQKVVTQLLLALAGEGILAGRLTLTKAAAGEAIKMGKGSADDLDKARLYKAAAEAPSGRASDALKALDRIASDSLSNDDAEIRDVAGYIARVVTGKQGVGADEAASMPPKDAGKIASAIESPEIADALDHADAILEKADQLILGKRQ